MKNAFNTKAEDYPVAVSVDLQKRLVSVTLADGRIISSPLDWHPWLANATAEQQANIEINHFSVDWPDLDEGLDIQGMLEDDAKWDASFARSQGFLQELADEARTEYEAGLTEDFDPETDPDLQ